MPGINEKPDKAQIMQEHEFLVGKWSAAHRRWAKYDSYLDQRHDIWNGRNRAQIRTSRASNIIHTAVATMQASEFVIHRPPVRQESEESEKWADNIENALQAIIEDSLSQDSTLLTDDLNTMFDTYGYAVLEGPILDFTEMPEEPEEPEDSTDEIAMAQFKMEKAQFESAMKNWNPILMNVPHPTEVLIDPEAKRIQLAIKDYEITASDVARIARSRVERGVPGAVLFNQRGYKDHDNVRVLERFTMKWHTLMTHEGEVLFTEPNTWGFIPFQHGYAGWGRRPGKDSTMTFAESMARGLLDDLIERGDGIGMLRAHDQNTAAKHITLMNHAFRPMGTTQDPQDMSNQLREDAIIQGEQGDVWIADFPEVSAQLFAAGDEINSDIQRATLSDALGGSSQPGVRSAAQQAILQDAGQGKFEAITRLTTRMWANAIGNILRLADANIGKAFGVNGRMLVPTHIEHSYYVDVEFKDANQAAQLARREVGMREYQLGLKDRRSYWETDEGISDVTERATRLIEDFIDAYPELQEIMAKRVAASRGIGDEFDAAVAARQGQARGLDDGSIPQISGTRDPRQALTNDVTNPARNGTDGFS